MKIYALCAALVLSGCAASVDGLGKKSPALTFESSKDAQAVANCLALKLYSAGDVLRLSDDHNIVTRKNGYGMIMVRWDFINTPSGSRVELRSQTPFGEGADKARSCA